MLLVVFVDMEKIGCRKMVTRLESICKEARENHPNCFYDNSLSSFNDKYCLERIETMFFATRRAR